MDLLEALKTKFYPRQQVDYGEVKMFASAFAHFTKKQTFWQVKKWQQEGKVEFMKHRGIVWFKEN